MNRSLHPRPGFGADFHAATPASPPAEDALAELLLAVRRQVWTLALGASVGLFLGLFHYATSPRTYEAGAALLIEEKQSELEQEISAVLPTARSDTSMLNEMQILRSLEVATEVVAALDLTENSDFLAPPSSLLSQWIRGTKDAIRGLIPVPEAPVIAPSAGSEAAAAERRLMETAERLRNRTVFHRVGRSFVVEIWFASHDPQLAADIVNAYAEAYIADGVRANIEASDRTAAWMEARLQELRVEALAAAQEAEDFRLQTGATDQQGLRDREQRAEALNDLVLRFQSRYRELALESSFPVAEGRILSRALPPRDASAPRAWQVLAAGLFLGLMLGLGAAVWREARETGYRTAGDVTERLGVPFLGYVPRLGRAGAMGRNVPGMSPVAGALTLARRKRTQRRGLPPRHLAEPGGGEGVDRDLPPLPGLSGGLAADPEGLRALRSIFAGLDAGQAGPLGRFVAIGALTGAEDAGAVSAGLAHVAAQAGRRVLLLDADLEAAELSRSLGLGAGQGALGVLTGETDLAGAVVSLPEGEIDILPAGMVPGPGAVEAPLSFLGELGELSADLREAYDFVFAVLPPLAEAPESKAMLRHCDGLILAVAWGRMPRKLVQSHLEHEPETSDRVLGVALTGVVLQRLRRYGVARPARVRPWRFARRMRRPVSGRGGAQTP
jgi:uncharacterized protein involved in exopolysaccharide biosynthesis/Mrp family chromosome partitioning ATPase